jgi:acetyltransferase-like isoleucine patch superfamily enzyme
MTTMLIDALERLRREGYLVDPPSRFVACESTGAAGDTHYLAADQPVHPLAIHVDDGASDNLVVRSSGASTQGSRIYIQGKSNVIVIGRDALMHNADIRIPGSNCLFYFGAFGVSVQLLCFLCGSGNQIIIGDHAIVSDNVWISNSDMHSICDSTTGVRINDPGDIHLGAHCWLGKDVTVLKGAMFETGVIIGTKALAAAGTYEKDSIYGGVPARKIRGNVKWSLEECDSLESLAHAPSWLARQEKIKLYESESK